jgi:hypothetical protein
MKSYLVRNVFLGLIFVFVINGLATVKGQTTAKDEVFGKIKMLTQNGGETKEMEVRIRFEKDQLEIESLKGETIFKTFKYEEIKNAEYSYTKHPRWKSGLGLGATSVLFPPMVLIALPLGFTKHRRHWLTIKTEKDYAVLKLSKGLRKIFIPAFESYSSVNVDALGENK